MHESDQNDLSDEIAELRQSGGAAFEAGPELHDPNAYASEVENLKEETPAPAPKRLLGLSPLVLGGFSVLAVFVVVMYFMTRPQPTLQPGDLGPGISAENGLKGHLMTRWEGRAKDGKTLYQLRIEPMDMRPLNGAFSVVMGNPQKPMYMNVRLLDSTGFALCGKQILFAFDPARAAAAKAQVEKKGDASQKTPSVANDPAIQSQQAAEAERERGKDIFQNDANADGQIIAANAQGALPCSVDQYKRADYWDFDTNFPTVDEQTALVDPDSSKPKKTEEHRKAQKKPFTGFRIQGDDRITDYDASRGMLEIGGKSFLISNSGHANAARWASNYLLVHYTCDQHANCVLTAGGGTSSLNARLNE